ncbi:MAG: TOBE domain-containing protein, partial [Rhodospirillaceae bacterium]|nr:TOBE domain-containing protein [Rhodospirillaceae bacterium]
EKMMVHREEPGSGETNWAKGVVADIVYLGDVSIYHVELASGRKVQVSQINLRHTSEQRLTWDDEVYISWHPGNSLVLMQ